MRLNEQEKQALLEAGEKAGVELYLFGSRVHDDKRGGDIDVIVFSDQNSYRLAQQISINFFKRCEEKIDVIVMNPDALTEEQKAFLNVIVMERIV